MSNTFAKVENGCFGNDEGIPETTSKGRTPSIFFIRNRLNPKSPVLILIQKKGAQLNQEIDSFNQEELGELFHSKITSILNNYSQSILIDCHNLGTK